MQQMVTFGCGHRESVSLVGTSPASEETVRLLRHSSCPACQRQSQYAAACQCAEEAGLLPLQAGCLQHLALAEITRASLWRVHLPSNVDKHPCQLVAALFNQQIQASIWLAMRGWPMYRANTELVKHLLLGVLQAEEKENTHD